MIFYKGLKNPLYGKNELAVDSSSMGYGKSRMRRLFSSFLNYLCVFLSDSSVAEQLYK